MEAKHLVNSVDIVARGVVSESTHTATHIRVITLDIHLTSIGAGTCDVEYELGTLVNGEFVVLGVETPHHKATYTLGAEAFALLADTPISPVERSKTLYDIIRDRIYGYLQSANIITSV